ncbi:MAG TPA: hypothetical protein VFI18_06870 [Gaiellales bacterium]|nr:hypothetical protein [Gaiellales bacterium]
MRTPLATSLGTVAALLAVAGCGQAAAGRGPGTAAAPGGAPVVSLTANAPGGTRVVGGTPGMRARARAILAGMGDVAIAEVRFGRPPAGFSRLRRIDGPIWLSTTAVAKGSPFAGPLRSQLAADGPLWQATVFANAYEASQPAGEPRVRGTSEALSVAGRRSPFSSETGPADPYGGAPVGDDAVRRTVARAATRGRFRVVSISIAHANRQAVTVVVRALRRGAFARRYEAFVSAMNRLDSRLDGLQWQVVDRCGYPVAVQSAGAWTSPRWLCPNPYVPGLAMTRATCRKLPRGFPPCGG